MKFKKTFKEKYLNKLLNEWQNIYAPKSAIDKLFRSPSDLIDILYDEWVDDFDYNITLTKKEISKFVLKLYEKKQ